MVQTTIKPEEIFGAGLEGHHELLYKVGVSEEPNVDLLQNPLSVLLPILPLAGLRDYPVGVRIIETFTLAILLLFICACHLRNYFIPFVQIGKLIGHRPIPDGTKVFKPNRYTTYQSPLLTEEPSGFFIQCSETLMRTCLGEQPHQVGLAEVRPGVL